MSDVTPTYVTISTLDILSLEWWAGIDREGNDPEPGGMVVTLRNRDRKWEPLFSTNTINTHQRFKLTLDGTAEGVWYSTDFQISYPTDEEYSEVTITCGDGFELLALDDLPSLDPPDAQTYPDAVNHDEPAWYGRLGDPAGTIAVAQVRRVWRGRGRNRRRVRRTTWRQQVASEASGVTGNAGVYRNPSQLILGRPGAIVGDVDTAVYFKSSGATFGHVRVPIDGTETFNSTQEFSVEAWVKIDTNAPQIFVTGPSTAASDPIWIWAYETGSGGLELWIHDTAGAYVEYFTGGTPLAEDVWSHVLVTYSHRTAHIYVDSEEVAGSWGGTVPTLDAPAASTFLYIGADPDGGSGSTGVDIDEVAVYEHALAGERCHAHYTAGALRGWNLQPAGERIADIADSDLWSEASIQTTGRNVIPQMQFGQARLEEIAELAHAEGPRTLFFFNGSGNPVYLGHEWKAGATAYNTVQATFGDSLGSDIPMDSFDPIFDNEVYNSVEASREGGPLVTATDSASDDDRRRRNNPDFTDLLLTDDVYVESVAEHVLELYKEPTWRIASLTVNGAHSNALAKISSLDIGHLIRVKKEGVTGVAMDRVAHIIGKRKSLDRDRNLTCTWTLGRGFDGSDGYWHLGVVGFSELGTKTKITG